MIDKLEIADLARELSLDLHIVEKDYVLGRLLAGIAANPELSENWVFKGGTCLKKCYFETYRFSEDTFVATIRQQAGSYKDKDLVFPLVGDKPASESLPAAMPVGRHHSPAGWLLQRQDPAFAL